jgi:glucose/arabinose dehydrogenase
MSLLRFFPVAAALLPAFALTPAAESPARLQPVFENIAIERPIAVVVPPDGTNRLFLVQQRGLVRILPKDESGADAKTFLDLSGRKMEASEQSKFEEGLNGFAFHPKFAENGKFYVYYTQQDPKRACLSEMQVSKTDPGKADPSTERVLLEVLLPYWNHHSGNMVFGPDGLLYFTIGDGGGKPGGDPLRWAQNLFVLNAKILRIDVDKKTGARGYGIPSDNPFVGREAAREEVYAYGVRNPWGLSFDADGALWCADVGQDLFEEINLIEKGGNYGWSLREGMQKFPLRAAAEAPAGTTFADPIFVYDHTQGLSITGGFVYRGSKFPALKGAYIYGDWAFGRIWALKYDKSAKKVIANETLHQPPLDAKGKKALFQPAAFCEDADHEILALDWNGKIFRVMPQ